MPYQIKESKYSDIYEVIFTGEVDLSTRRRAVQERLTITEGKILKGILIDLRQAKLVMTTYEEFLFGVEKSEIEHLRSMRTAFVHGEESLDNEFIITVANNRGYDARGFLDREAAYQWLIER
jgi:hypothetical protein